MADSDSPRDTPSQVTQLLRDWQQGSVTAAGDLASLIHGELRRLAVQRLRTERREHTLQPTALVNEAWIRLADMHTDWQNRSHFMAAAATAMRRILVDHARQRNAAKRGLGKDKVALDDVLYQVPGPMPDDRLLALDEALTRLGTLDHRQATLVELRFFGGLSIEETATMMGTSTGTVKREWAAARAWLYDAMGGPAGV
ncbi:MAG: ECF-type sigma factor [Vicinamibacterales bacterium]